MAKQVSAQDFRDRVYDVVWALTDKVYAGMSVSELQSVVYYWNRLPYSIFKESLRNGSALPCDKKTADDLLAQYRNVYTKEQVKETWHWFGYLPWIKRELLTQNMPGVNNTYFEDPADDETFELDLIPFGEADDPITVKTCQHEPSVAPLTNKRFEKFIYCTKCGVDLEPWEQYVKG